MIAVAGGKGGCGKTTTTLGVARALGEGTVAVDADWDLPNLHAVAGVDRPSSGSEAAIETGSATSSGPVVVPAPEDVSNHDVGRLLQELRAEPGRVVVDCPAGGGPDAAAPLAAADATLLVTTPSPPALRDTVKTAAMARALDAPPVGVVLTRTDDPPDGVESLLETRVLAAVPAVRPPVLEDSRVRAAYRDVCSTLRSVQG